MLRDTGDERRTSSAQEIIGPSLGTMKADLDETWWNLFPGASCAYVSGGSGGTPFYRNQYLGKLRETVLTIGHLHLRIVEDALLPEGRAVGVLYCHPLRL